MKVTPAIESIGYGVSGEIGGLPRTTYYTPDGRVIRAIPSIVEGIKKDKDGNFTSYVLDTNLRDRGWLLSPPVVPKLFCKGCDKWHDTQEEVDTCIIQKNQWIEVMSGKTKKEETDKTSDLEKRVADLTVLVEKLMEGRNGQIFQSEANEPAQVPGEQVVGTAKERV